MTALGRPLRVNLPRLLRICVQCFNVMYKNLTL